MQRTPLNTPRSLMTPADLELIPQLVQRQAVRISCHAMRAVPPAIGCLPGKTHTRTLIY
jgi:hypothetical protein